MLSCIYGSSGILKTYFQIVNPLVSNLKKRNIGFLILLIYMYLRLLFTHTIVDRRIGRSELYREARTTGNFRSSEAVLRSTNVSFPLPSLHSRKSTHFPVMAPWYLSLVKVHWFQYLQDMFLFSLIHIIAVVSAYLIETLLSGRCARPVHSGLSSLRSTLIVTVVTSPVHVSMSPSPHQRFAIPHCTH